MQSAIISSAPCQNAVCQNLLSFRDYGMPSKTWMILFHAVCQKLPNTSQAPTSQSQIIWAIVAIEISIQMGNYSTQVVVRYKENLPKRSWLRRT